MQFLGKIWGGDPIKFQLISDPQPLLKYQLPGPLIRNREKKMTHQTAGSQ